MNAGNVTFPLDTPQGRHILDVIVSMAAWQYKYHYSYLTVDEHELEHDYSIMDLYYCVDQRGAVRLHDSVWVCRMEVVYSMLEGA